jgi:hypothetical protein
LALQGIRQGAPQARQVADRSHPLQNVPESIERQMTEVFGMKPLTVRRV